MITILVIILFLAALYLVLCVDDRVPESWNYCKILRQMPLPGMPTTNGFLFGVIVAAILALLLAI